MPLEYALLKDKPEVLEFCPACGELFAGFMRGEVQSWWRKLFKRPYCAVICTRCKDIVGWEKP